MQGSNTLMALSLRGEAANIRHIQTYNYYGTFFTEVARVKGVALSDADKANIVERLRIRRIRKHQYFLQEGDCCKVLGFILKGATRMYSVNHKGQETIVRFNVEKSWAGDVESFRTGLPTKYHIEAVEHTDMLIGSRQDLAFLSASIPAIQWLLEEDHYCQLIFNQQRINTVLSMNAEERYADLLANSPEYSQRFSQNMIACYLGIKPETLSRIRKNLQRH